MNNPLVSIIIPTYNRVHFIGETLDSVIAQTYKNWECIVVDDGSTDYTDEFMEFYCEKDSRIQYYHRPLSKPKGANGCRNYGFEICQGEYVNWFDSDDLMSPLFLEMKISTIIEAKSDVVFCASKKMIRSKAGFSIGEKYPLMEKSFFKNLLLRKFMISTHSGLWNKQILINIFPNFNIFDVELTQSQDYDFYFRALSKNISLKVLNEALFLYRVGDESISKRFLKYNEKDIHSFIKTREKVIYKFYDDTEIFFGILNQLFATFKKTLDNRDYKNSKYILSIFSNYLANQRCKHFYMKMKLLYTFNYITGRGVHYFGRKMRL